MNLMILLSAMPTWGNVAIIVLGLTAFILAIMYFMGNSAHKKLKESYLQLQAQKQPIAAPPVKSNDIEVAEKVSATNGGDLNIFFPQIKDMLSFTAWQEAMARFSKKSASYREPDRSLIEELHKRSLATAFAAEVDGLQVENFMTILKPGFTMPELEPFPGFDEKKIREKIVKIFGGHLVPIKEYPVVSELYEKVKDCYPFNKQVEDNIEWRVILARKVKDISTVDVVAEIQKIHSMDSPEQFEAIAETIESGFKIISRTLLNLKDKDTLLEQFKKPLDVAIEILRQGNRSNIMTTAALMMEKKEKYYSEKKVEEEKESEEKLSEDETQGKETVKENNTTFPSQAKTEKQKRNPK